MAGVELHHAARPSGGLTLPFGGRASVVGLLMDLDATGDAVRTDRAFDDFVATIETA